MNTQQPNCWVLTDGKMGCRRQALGLAKALGWNWTEKTAHKRRPYYWLPASWRWGSLQQLSQNSDSLSPPWPDWVISCGFRVVPISLAIKAASSNTTQLIHVQNPRIGLHHFDWVIAAHHDQITGPNVLQHLGALHDLNPQQFTPNPTNIDHPKTLSLIIGGDTKHHRLSKQAIARLLTTLTSIAQQWPGRCLWVTSRRTPDALSKAIRHLASAHQGQWIGPNQPGGYQQALQSADCLLVTNDSCSMLTECTATGKPIHILDFPGFKNKRKYKHLINDLIRKGYATPYQGEFKQRPYPPLFEAQRIAELIQGNAS